MIKIYANAITTCASEKPNVDVTQIRKAETSARNHLSLTSTTNIETYYRMLPIINRDIEHISQKRNV